MTLKHMFVAFLYLSSAMSWGVERPPRFPEPGRPAPERPVAPRPERPPTPRPERPPTPRPPERPERPPVRPPERPERPPTPPAPRPPDRPPRPQPPRPPAPRPPAPRPPYDPYPPYPSPTPMPPYEEQVMVYVNRSFYNYERLQLDQYVNEYSYRGYRINAIEVTLDSYAGGGQFSLVIDGQIDRTQYVYNGYQNFVMYPSRYVQWGYNAHDISFLVRGTNEVYVRHLILRMSR